MATILSDLLNAIRIGRSDWAIIELGAPGGLQFKRDDRAYVHFVLDGSVMLDGAGMPSPSVWSLAQFPFDPFRVRLDLHARVRTNSTSMPCSMIATRVCASAVPAQMAVHASRRRAACS